ncbi:MAG: nicotinate-nucleotide adenylyltransferase [Dehalococcoidia bacterium]
MGALRLGVLGGTFDPIHVGHLVLAQEARWQLSLDRVLLVPAGEPWRKAGRAITPFPMRVEMVRLAAEGGDYLEVSTLEGDRPGPSYTVDTLESLLASHPGARLVLILGEDALADLPNWKDAERIAELAEIAVAQRPGNDASDSGIRWTPIDMPKMEISSSTIRERAGRGEPFEAFLCPAVAAYIHEHGVYGG